jgi:hypothetical protein
MTLGLTVEHSNGAVFSLDKVYRYKLWRTFLMGDGVAAFILLNPSTADETHNDPTIRRCLNFAKKAGFYKVIFGNLFAFRNTYPETLLKILDPIGNENDKYLIEIAKESTCLIFGWGNQGLFLNRGEYVAKLLNEFRPSCLDRLTKFGCPKHPLYLRGNVDINDYQLERKMWEQSK